VRELLCYLVTLLIGGDQQATLILKTLKPLGVRLILVRKGIVIVGLALLGLGVVVAGVGLLLTTKSVTPLVQGFSGGLSNTTVIGVGESYPIARVHAGEFGVVAYNDSADTPLNVSIPGATSVVYGSAEADGGRLFMAVFVAGANSTVVLTNNQTTAVRVYYGLSEASGLGSIAASGLLIVMGGFLFIVGIILAIVGAVLKNR
jgi:hypothetical protein